MNKKVLITGGAGFIGLNLANKLLDQNYSVHIVDNFARGVMDANPEFTALQSVIGMSSSSILAAPISNATPYSLFFGIMSVALKYHLAPSGTVWNDPFHSPGMFRFRNKLPSRTHDLTDFIPCPDSFGREDPFGRRKFPGGPQITPVSFPRSSMVASTELEYSSCS